MKLLSSICDYAKEKTEVPLLELNNYISTENMLPNKAGIVRASSVPTINQTQGYRKGDVLISNIRPYFKKIWLATYDGGCSKDVLVLRAKNGIDTYFLYYVLSNDDFFRYAMATSKGTKMPRGDKKSLMQYEVPEFDLVTQKNIGHILSDLDNKIYLNNLINKNLEQQAKAIFASEFLSYGELPKEWKKESLLDIADYLNGLAMQKFRPSNNEIDLPVLKIKELRQGSCDSSSERCSTNIDPKYIVHDGDVIFSWSGSLIVNIWCGGICGLNQHLFKVTSAKYDKWFYYAWTLHHLERFIAIASDMATTMGHIKRDELSKSEVLIPSKKDYDRIGSLLEPICANIINNRLENRKLVALRDSLLPKLMSGELDVSDIDL